MDSHFVGSAVVVSELVRLRDLETPEQQDSCWWGKRGKVNHAWAKKVGKNTWKTGLYIKRGISI